MEQKLSVIIPTYNRPQYLRRTIAFLQSQARQLPVVVADGSVIEDAARNRVICERADGSVSYFHVAPDPNDDYAARMENYHRRLLDGIDRTTTPYLVLLADDDLLLPECAEEAAEFLDGHDDYSACHGLYLTFRYADREVLVDGIAYETPTIGGETIDARLAQLFGHYESTFYAVYRRGDMRNIIDVVAKSKGLFSEIYQAAATVVLGKVNRIPRIYMLRNVGVPPHAHAIPHWAHWLTHDFDDFLVNYKLTRTRLSELTMRQPNPGLDAESMQRALDRSFLEYMGRQNILDDPTYDRLATAFATQEHRPKRQTEPSPGLGGGGSPLVTGRFFGLIAPLARDRPIGRVARSMLRPIIRKLVYQAQQRRQRPMLSALKAQGIRTSAPGIRLAPMLFSRIARAECESLLRQTWTFQ